MTDGLSVWSRWMLTGFGLGRMRPFPGTWGSLVGLPIGAVALWVMSAGLWWAVLVLVVFGAWFSWVCVARGDEAEAVFGGKDPSAVVADEVAGMCVTLLAVPMVVACGWRLEMWELAGALMGAFVLFRVFDIVKIWPAGALQAMAGGWGVLLDDLVAGVQAGVCLGAGLIVLS